MGTVAGQLMENEWVTGKISITVRETPLNFEVTVPARPVKLRRMLPVFQQMTNSVVGIGVQAAELQGREISCKAGCGACCRQPVPLSEAEVFQLAELVESMPEARRTEVKRRFADAVEHFNGMGWFDSVAECATLAADGEGETAQQRLIELVHNYFEQGISCPFLENEACSIHESRPLACREYLVTSPAENCSDPAPEKIEKVEMLFQPSKAVSQISSTGKFAGFGLLPLIRAVELGSGAENADTEKSGEGWLADLFGCLSADPIPAREPVSGNSPRPRPKKRKKKR